jgi:hypothetical protein
MGKYRREKVHNSNVDGQLGWAKIIRVRSEKSGGSGI